MQAVTQHLRQFTRLFVTGGLNSERQRLKTRPLEPLNFVTGTSGFSKSLGQTHGLKKWTYGDDAYFIAKHKAADVIGIADGVGGWRNYGVDPSTFSRTLMGLCERMVNEGRFQPHAPATIIKDSYEELMQLKVPLLGSSTACVVALHKEERTIYSANLGDSGFLLIRNGEVVHRSQEQQHYFNTPFQLAVAPPGQEGMVLSDRPEMADSTSYQVEEGDVILMGTDGLFDNMHEDMIVDYITKLKDMKEESIQTTATNIAERAHQLSFDPDYLSPFAVSAIDAGIEIRGGKPDDITVMVARVSYDPPVS